ncbi:MAG TPA: arylsulfatase [Candidatus Angelobacter sp.]|nr:arylsulfatase [Candidatus Angelobacter sp.]
MNRLARTLLVFEVLLIGTFGTAQQKKPNILVIFGDDIGWFNISAYNHGVMGYRTPNIDRIVREGAMFTDYYAQQSCTAGRAAFITGQSPIRTGLLKVGLPGASLGLQKEDPTLAELLKPMGYMTFQHGKNHLGDRNEFLPTVHGFDEFFGNLYHLNAEQEPENVDYPKNPEFKQKYGPRGVLKCKATPTENPAPPDPRFGPWGKQTCEDTGPLTTKRMETADEEFMAATLNAMERSVKAGKPFFIWHNTTRMHIWTHLQPKYQALVAEKGLYGAGMTEFDDEIGVMLKKLDDLGIADNTIVIITTDNGAEVFSWPDGGTTPFRGEKNTNWEGGYRVPAMVRWPGVVKPGTVINNICAGEDWLPTLMAAAGDSNIKDELLAGHKAGSLTYKVHLDGYNWIPYFKGDVAEGPRKEFLYWTDDGDLAALRWDKWKVVFLEQRAHGLDVWRDPLIPLRAPLLFDLHADPFERAQHEAGDYVHWYVDRMYAMVPAQAFVQKWLSSFKEYPPRQKAASFSLDKVMQQLTTPPNGSN